MRFVISLTERRRELILDSSQFVLATATEFETFVAKRSDVHFQQTREFGDLQAALGHQPFYFAVKHQGVLVAAVLVTLAKVKLGYLAEAHGNPYFSEDVADNQLLISGAKKVLKKHGVIQLIIHSNQMVETYDDNWQVTGEGHTTLPAFYQRLGFKQAQLSDFEKSFSYNYSKDLAGFDNFTSLQKSYKKNGLQTIKKARQFGIQIKKATYEDMAEFKKVVDEAGERRQFATRDLSYYQSVYRAFGDRVVFLMATINFQTELVRHQAALAALKAEIAQAEAQNKKKSLDTLHQRLARMIKFEADLEKLVARHGDQSVTLAAAQFFIMPTEILYMFSGMYDDFREFSAPFLIQDEMLRYAHDHGITRYHFMGVNAPDNPDQGVLKFKQNFKGYIWQSSGNYEMVIHPFLNALSKGLKKIMGR